MSIMRDSRAEKGTIDWSYYLAKGFELEVTIIVFLCSFFIKRDYARYKVSM